MLIVSSTNLLECCSLPKMFLNPLVDQALGLLLLELLIVCPNIVLVLVTCIVLLSYRWLKYKNKIFSITRMFIISLSRSCKYDKHETAHKIFQTSKGKDTGKPGYQRHAIVFITLISKNQRA
jgi:hypothetical protein